MAISGCFYDPKGNVISLEDFICFYNKAYYLNNSAVVEEKIEELLEAKTMSSEDVMLILEWKLGRIDHKESQSKGQICFRDNDSVKQFKTVTRYGKIDATEICDYISNQFSYLKQETPYNIFKSLLCRETSNIGTVYLITLLYFITSGEYPIYDRFAMMALDAIAERKRPGAEVRYKPLPEKRQFVRSMVKNGNHSDYCRYMLLLEDVFKEYYTRNKKNRDIDRALWVYGHLFKEKA